MTSETCEVYGHYLTGNIPAEIAENLKEFYPEDGDISCEEFYHQQVSVYQSTQAYGKNKSPASNLDQTSGNMSLACEGESSHGAIGPSQLELDEALARLLQDGLDEGFEDFYISQPNGVAAENRDSSPQATPARVTSLNIREDDIDPDNMTYEELQSLGEAVGCESRGLPSAIISQLPTFKYKTGLFSKKRIKEECVICCAEYISGARLINLPCAHKYHSECITRWLKDNRTCPICQVEVQETDFE